MEELSEIARYGVTGISVLLVVSLVIVIDKFLKQIAISDKRHELTYKALAKSIDKNSRAADRSAKAAEENLAFMRNLNGKLTQATIEKVKGGTCDNTKSIHK